MEQIALVAVVGPTASGKTALGVELARRLGGEVVSADSMQIYRGMDIATAKPTQKDMQGVPHHLIGTVDPGEEYSVARYVADAGACIGEVAGRGRLPILVGGTGLYVSSLLDGILFAEERRDAQLRADLRRQAEREGNEAMHRRLAAIDPETAAALHPNNLGRVLRAIEVFKLTGIPMSRHRAASRSRPSPYAPVVLGLDFTRRTDLYRRIDARVDAMLAQGLLEEARDFFAQNGAKTAAQAIGIKELLPFFEQTEPLESCVERLKRETRRLAKRQLTWFRRDGRIRWLLRDGDNWPQIVSDALAAAGHLK